MIIRDAKLKDEKRVFFLAKKFAKSFDIIEIKFNKTFNEFLINENVSFIVAEIDNEVIGYGLTFHHQTFYANGLVSWVQEIIIDEELRGRGIGSKMMKRVEEISKEKNAKLISLATIGAGEFYKKLGYKECATYYKKLL